MLVSKKQEWEHHEQHLTTEQNNKLPKPQLDAPLRKRCLGIVFLLIFMAVAITIQSEWIVRSGYDLVEMKKQVVRLEKENEEMHLAIAKLRAPSRIERIATSQLGLVQPASVYYAAAGAATTTETGKEKTDHSLLGFVKAEIAQNTTRR